MTRRVNRVSDGFELVVEGVVVLLLVCNGCDRWLELLSLGVIGFSHLFKSGSVRDD